MRGRDQEALAGVAGQGVRPGRPRVSVVIATKGRPLLLERCLTALTEQTLSPTDYEVVVVDDGPHGDTRRLVEGFDRSKGASFRYLVNRGPGGPAGARNTGWRSARGRIVAFTDDDTEPSPGWLAAGLAAFVDGVTGVSGRLVMPLPPEPTDYERDAARLEEAEFVTANCFYRREALAAVGGFDERFRMAWREDSDLHFSLMERGYRLERAPGAVVVHPLRPASWGVSVPQQQKGRFNALLFKKHPALYRERIGASPRWYYLAAAGLAGGLVGFSTGRRRWAAGSLLVWLLLTLRFAAFRLAPASRRPAHILEMLVTSAVIPPVSLFWRLRGALAYRVWFW